jgi:hypothetical protein
VEPRSPAFSLKDRLANRKRPATPGEVEPEAAFRAKPPPHFGVPNLIQVMRPRFRVKNCLLIFLVRRRIQRRLPSLRLSVVWKPF